MKRSLDNQKELLSEIKSGDIDAFDMLYWECHKAVYANIFRLVKDQEAAKDILQEVFVALWIKRESLDAAVNLPGWLFTTSYRKSIDYLRIALVQPLGKDLLDELEDEAAHTDESRYEAIQLAVSQLSPQKRKVFELCKLKGKTYEETAKELNISKHTVKEYLSAAILQIKEYIHQLPKSAISIFLFLVFHPPVL